MATVKTPAQRAKHVKLVQIVYYYCWLASSDNLLQCTYNYVFRKYFFCLVAPLTHRSNSKAIHKFSKFITGISFYYIQQVINPHRQQGYIINTKVFTAQQITSHEMNFNSTIPRRWKRLLWTTCDSLGRAMHCRSGDQRRTDHPGWSGLLYQYHGREPCKCPRYRHIFFS